jgi:hypothetical protein
MTEAERKLLLIVARWMLRTEGGVFDSVRSDLEEDEHARYDRQFGILRELIDKVERAEGTP